MRSLIAPQPPPPGVTNIDLGLEVEEKLKLRSLKNMKQKILPVCPARHTLQITLQGTYLRPTPARHYIAVFPHCNIYFHSTPKCIGGCTQFFVVAVANPYDLCHPDPTYGGSDNFSTPPVRYPLTFPSSFLWHPPFQCECVIYSCASQWNWNRNRPARPRKRPVWCRCDDGGWRFRTHTHTRSQGEVHWQSLTHTHIQLRFGGEVGSKGYAIELGCAAVQAFGMCWRSGVWKWSVHRGKQL